MIEIERIFFILASSLLYCYIGYCVSIQSDWICVNRIESGATHRNLILPECLTATEEEVPLETLAKLQKASDPHYVQGEFYNR